MSASSGRPFSNCRPMILPCLRLTPAFCAPWTNDNSRGSSEPSIEVAVNSPWPSSAIHVSGGHDIPPIAEGQDVSESSEKFAGLYRLLATHNVKVAMAGDTHDFEYYRDNIVGDGPARVMHHFVNGGGGAYLSIGTA